MLVLFNAAALLRLLYLQCWFVVYDYISISPKFVWVVEGVAALLVEGTKLLIGGGLKVFYMLRHA